MDLVRYTQRLLESLFIFNASQTQSIAPYVSSIEIVGDYRTEDSKLSISDEHRGLPADADFDNTGKAVQGTRVLYQNESDCVSGLKCNRQKEQAYACLWDYNCDKGCYCLRIKIGGIDTGRKGHGTQLRMLLADSSEMTIFASHKTILDSPNTTFDVHLLGTGTDQSNSNTSKAPYGFWGKVMFKICDYDTTDTIDMLAPINLEFYLLSVRDLPDTLKGRIPLQLLRMFVLAASARKCQTPKDWIETVVGIVHGSIKPCTGEQANTADHWLKFESKDGDCAFASEKGGTMNVQAWLDVYQKFQKWGVATPINCYDQAAITEVALSLGLSHDCIHWEFHQVYGFIQNTDLVGFGTCNNPYFDGNTSKIVYEDLRNPDRKPFRNHAYLSWTDQKLTEDDYKAYNISTSKLTYPEYLKAARKFEEKRGIRMLMIDACAGPHFGTETREEYESQKERILDFATSFSTWVREDSAAREWRWVEEHYLGVGISGIDSIVRSQMGLLSDQQATRFPEECNRIAQLFSNSGHPNSPVAVDLVKKIEGVFTEAFTKYADSKGWNDAVWLTIRPYQLDDGTRIHEAKVYFAKGKHYLSLVSTINDTACKAREKLASRLAYNEFMADDAAHNIQRLATESGVSIVGRGVVNNDEGSLRALLWNNVSGVITGTVSAADVYDKLAAVVSEELSQYR